MKLINHKTQNKVPQIKKRHLFTKDSNSISYTYNMYKNIRSCVFVRVSTKDITGLTAPPTQWGDLNENPGPNLSQFQFSV